MIRGSLEQLVTAFGHLRGQTVRFGGITADWLAYVADAAVSAPCTWGKHSHRTGGRVIKCPFIGTCSKRLMAIGS